MDVLDLIIRARSAGVAVFAVDGRLLVRGRRRQEPIARELIGREREVLATLRAVDTAERDTAAGVPCPLPWRSELAAWPEEWRGRWGRRANELAEAGARWPEDERIAFIEAAAERARRRP
jgi:hypothetical protein